MNLPQQKRVFDPVNNKFTSVDTSRGILIKEYNDFCEKCPTEDIYDFSSGKCKKIDNKLVKNKLKDEIAYCKKYNKAMKRDISADSRIVDNILNIRIPEKFFNKSGLKVKDFIMDSISSKNSFLAKKLNIKNLAYVEYVNFIPVLIYTLYQLFSLNPELKSILVKSVSKVLSSTKGGLVSIYIKVFTEYIKSDFLIALVSKFSFTKFIAFVTSVLAVFSNLPSSSGENKQKMTRVAEVIATGKNVPFDIFNLDNSGTMYSDTRKSINPDSTESSLLKNYLRGTYRESDNTVSLAKLGLNNKTVGDSNTRLVFGYDDIHSMPFVEIQPGNYKSKKSVFIIPEKERESKISELVEKTTSLIKVLERTQDSFSKLRENIQKSKQLKEMDDDIENLKSQQENVKKFTAPYGRISKKISEVSKKSERLKKELGEFTDISDEEKKQINPKIKSVTEWKNSLLSIRKELIKLNSSNFNFSYNDFKETADSATRFVKTINDPEISVTRLPFISNSQSKIDSTTLVDIGKTPSIIQRSSIFKNLNKKSPPLSISPKKTSPSSIFSSKDIMNELFGDTSDSDEETNKLIGIIKNSKENKPNIKEYRPDDN